MRRKLQAFLNAFHTFRGTFVRFGTTKRHKTALFRMVKDEKGTIVAGHVWVLAGKAFEQITLHEGNEVLFTAKAVSYVKGYRGAPVTFDRETEMKLDYQLQYVGNLRKVSPVDAKK